MNIGIAAERSGLPAKTIRYYEDVGLVSPERGENGYRRYSDTLVHKLRFLHRARSLGFGIEECRQLLALYEDRDRASGDVKRLAETKIAEVDRKIAELQDLRGTLLHLATNCRGDERPDCPILDELAAGRADEWRGLPARANYGRY